MIRRHTLVAAAVVLAGLILAAGTFWAFTSVWTPSQLRVSVAGATLPIENKPNTSQPSSGELQAAARVAVEFLNADIVGCQAAIAAWQSRWRSRGDNIWQPIPSEPIVEHIRPYATDRLVQNARSEPNNHCRWLPTDYGLSRVKVFGIISEGWTDISHDSLSDRELRLLIDSWEWLGEPPHSLRQANIRVLLIRQPDGWKVDEVGLGLV